MKVKIDDSYYFYYRESTYDNEIHIIKNNNKNNPNENIFIYLLFVRKHFHQYKHLYWHIYQDY